MDERRKSPRKRTEHFFGVFDRDSGDYVGKLVDLSIKGLMLRAEGLMKIDSINEFRIELPGISKAQASTYHHKDEEYHFCCKGCVDLFVTDPEKYLEECRDLIVCPNCLAEKPLHMTVKLEIKGQELHFCRCPYCTEVVKKKPEFYINRLAGTVPNESAVLDHEGCCIRPD